MGDNYWNLSQWPGALQLTVVLQAFPKMTGKRKDEEDENDIEEYFKINNEEDDIDDNDCSEEDNSKKWS